MQKFNVTYYINGQTVHQKFEGENSEEVRDKYVIRESQWIKDSKGHDKYINLERVDLISITPVARVSAARGW